VRNTFLQVTDDGVSNSRTLPRSKSVPAGHSVSESASADDAASTGTSPSMDDSENSSTGFLEQALPSLGSALHFDGKCVPCSLFAKNRCRFELTCKYCHVDHPGQLRPNKRTRNRRKGIPAADALLPDVAYDMEHAKQFTSPYRPCMSINMWASI